MNQGSLCLSSLMSLRQLHPECAKKNNFPDSNINTLNLLGVEAEDFGLVVEVGVGCAVSNYTWRMEKLDMTLCIVNGFTDISHPEYTISTNILF